MRPPTPSPLARREALRRQLALALAQRDRGAVLRLSTQWVHRHGVASLEPLMLELAGGGSTSVPSEAAGADLLPWWRQVLREPVAPAASSPAPRAVSAAPEPAASEPAVPAGPAARSATLSGASLSAPQPSGARVLPFPPASARRRPAPAPAHPGLASLRAWLSTPSAAGGADPSAAAGSPEELDRAA